MGTSDTTAGPPKDSPEVRALIHDHLELVAIIAHQLRRDAGRGLPHEALVSYGHEGLLQAARSFDPAHGVRFNTWASIRIRGAMIDGMRADSGIPRRLYRRLQHAQAAREAMLEDETSEAASTPEAADAALTRHLATLATASVLGFFGTTGAAGTEVPDADMDRVTPEDQLAEAELLQALNAAIARLPAPEQALVERHYFQGARFDHVSQELGLSKSWGSRLHARALDRIASDLRRARVLGT